VTRVSWGAQIRAARRGEATCRVTIDEIGTLCGEPAAVIIGVFPSATPMCRECYENSPARTPGDPTIDDIRKEA
jgi:hypothetical protein